MAKVFRYLTRGTTLLLACYWLSLFAATHWPRLDVGIRFDAHSPIELDKVAHTVLFGGLAVLMILARPWRRRLGDLSITLVAVATLAYAAFDERTQGIFHRDPTIPDFCADAIAVLSVYLIAMARPAAGGGQRRWVGLARVGSLLLITAVVGAGLIGRGQDWTGWFYRPGVAMGPSAGMLIHAATAVLLLAVFACAMPAGVARPRVSRALAILVAGLSVPAVGMLMRHVGRGFDVRVVWWHELGLLAALVVWSVATATRPLWGRPVADASADAEALAAGAADDSRFVRHAALVSGLTMLSRVTGLLRDSVLAATLGLSGVSDAFFIGFLIPNLFRRLFGEGALTAAFIPNYTDLLKKDPAVAKRFASVCIAGLTVLLAGLTLVGEAVLWLLAGTKSWSHDSLLAIHLAMVMLPYMPMVCLVALVGGMLQVHHRFGPPAAAPVLLNLTMVGLTIAASAGLVGASEPEHIAMMAGAAVLIAGVLQLAWQFAALSRSTSLTTQFAGTRQAVGSMTRMMLPMLLGLAVFQINAFFDSLIAFGLSPKQAGAQSFALFGHQIAYPIQTGAVAALQWSQRLYQFPLGVFGVAIATAIFPALSHAAADAGDADRFGRIFRQGLRLTVFVGLPATAGLVLVRLPLARVVYEHAAFTLTDANRVATILLGYAVSIWAYSLAGVVTRGFYAKKDANTPLKVAVAMVGVNLALNLTLIWWLGAAGLAWSTAICAAVQVGILLRLVRKHLAAPVDGEVWRSWLRTAGLTAVMVGALAPMLWVWPAESLTAWGSAGLLAAMVVVGLVVVLGGAWVTGAEELRWLRRRKVEAGG